MNKDIMLPGRRYMISQDPERSGMAKITTLRDASYALLVRNSEILPMACALIEIYEGIEAEKEEYRERQAREAGEPVKGT